MKRKCEEFLDELSPAQFLGTVLVPLICDCGNHRGEECRKCTRIALLAERLLCWPLVIFLTAVICYIGIHIDEYAFGKSQRQRLQNE